MSKEDKELVGWEEMLEKSEWYFPANPLVLALLRSLMNLKQVYLPASANSHYFLESLGIRS